MTTRGVWSACTAAWCVLIALSLAGCGGTPANEGVPASGTSADIAGRSAAERPPVILVSIDTLRSDHLPVYGYEGVETPALDRFAEDAVVFDRAYAHYPLTLPSHVTLLTGRLPADAGVRDNARYRLDESLEPYLPSLLQRSGYATGGMVSSYALRGSSGISRGFDRYDDELAETNDLLLFGDERSGAATLTAARPWLDSAGSRPFLFFHVYEPHLPHTPPEPFLERWGATYEGEIATADAVVGELFDDLHRLGLYDKALIFVLSDHGEEFGEHGEEGHGILLYRQSIQVPLLMKLPGGAQAGRRFPHPVQLADVLPTILEVTGLDAGAASSDLAGTSLLRLMASEDEDDVARRPIFSETIYPRIHYGWHELTSLVQGDRHLVSGRYAELFDLAADPEEIRDILSGERRVYRAMDDVLQQLASPFRNPAEEDEDPETRQRLASLGYLSSSVSVEDASLLDPRDEISEIAPVLERAQAHLFAKEYERAEPLFRQLVERNPHMPDAWESLGISLKSQGRFGDAVDAFRRALEISASPQTALLAGESLMELSRLEEAEEHFLLAWNGDQVGSRDFLVSLELQRGDPSAALTWARRDEGLEALAPPTLLRLVRALGTDGQRVEALAVAEALVAMEPAAAAWNELARLHIQGGEIDSARQALDRAMDLEPGNAPSLEWLGLLELQGGRIDRALELLGRSVEVDPERANAWNLLAVARFQTNDVAGALAAWERAVTLDPEHLDALYNLGTTAARAGRLDLAFRSLRRYAEVAAADPARSNELARVREMIRQLQSRGAVR